MCGVAVGHTVGAVGGGVVGGTVASASGHSDWSYHSDEKNHGANDDSNVETDTDACVVLLGSSSAAEGHYGEDESGEGESEADDRPTAYDESEEGEHEGAYGHSGVVLLRRRHGNGGRCRRLCCHHDGSVGELRLVAVGGLIRFVDIRWRRSLFKRRVGRRKVVCLRRIALWRIALYRRRRVRRGAGALVLKRLVAIGHWRRVGRLSRWLVGLLGGVVRGRHRIVFLSSSTPTLLPYMADGAHVPSPSLSACGQVLLAIVHYFIIINSCIMLYLTAFPGGD